MSIRKDINGMAVFLAVEQGARGVEAVLAIARPLDSDPIRDDVVAVILETTDHHLLQPTAWPDPGFLPETSLGGGSTAHARFGFKQRRGARLARAIVVVRGDWAEYDLVNLA
jgi:hypothetical protein